MPGLHLFGFVLPLTIGPFTPPGPYAKVYPGIASPMLGITASATPQTFQPWDVPVMVTSIANPDRG